MPLILLSRNYLSFKPITPFFVLSSPIPFVLCPIRKGVSFKVSIENFHDVADTRANDKSERYYGPKMSFDAGDVAGMFTQGGNVNGGETEPGFFNERMYYSGGSFASDSLNVDISNLRYCCLYVPYYKGMFSEKGVPVRKRGEDSKEYTVDMLAASSLSQSMSFTHAFSILDIKRGYLFDEPKKADVGNEEYKKAPKEAQDNDKYYMQVRLAAPVINMQFWPQVPDYWTYTLASNQGVADFRFIGTPEEIAEAKLISNEVDPVNYDYEVGRDYSMFDGFKQFQGEDGKTHYGILLPTVDNEEFNYTLRDESNTKVIGSQRGGGKPHSSISSISLWDNDGVWRTITDIVMVEHGTGLIKPDEVKRLYGNTCYPLEIKMDSRGASLFPVAVMKWDEKEIHAESDMGISSPEEFNDLVSAYNQFLLDHPDRSKLTVEEIDNFINGGESSSGFGYATIQHDGESIIGCKFTFLITGPISMGGFTKAGGCVFPELAEGDTFDGGGYPLTELFIEPTASETDDGVGFVRKLDGTLKDVVLESIRLTNETDTPTGVFCVSMGGNASVEGCTARNISVAAPKSKCGAIAGTVTAGDVDEQRIAGCTVTGIIQGQEGDNQLWGVRTGEGAGPDRKNNRIDVVFIDTMNN